MRKPIAQFVALFAALLLALPAARAQEQERTAYARAELEQLLAPIALYPDPLLSQVLMAATYPLEVVQAARWSRAHPGLVGDEAVRAAAAPDWDPSVKSLLAFPQLLARMDEKLEWTRQLGEAFLAQEGDVMDAVQHLRRQARAAGHLLGDERVRVIDDGGALAIEYADPLVVYVPAYDPWIVYGNWWWPAYPPVAWAPWPGYAVVRSGLWWGTGIGVTVGFFYGALDWPHRHVKILHVHNHYVRRPAMRRAVTVHRPLAVGRWRHDAAHRRGAAYRQPEARKPLGVAPTPKRAAPTRRSAPRAAPRAVRRGHLVPPAWRSSAPAAMPPRAAGSQPPRRPMRAVPYHRGHGGSGRTLDRADRRSRARADAPQHRAAQPHGFARHPGRNAGAVPVRPPLRLGVARDRPRLGR
jgi:hypothetical protein